MVGRSRGAYGLKAKLICLFKLVADMVEGGIREFVHDMDRLALLKRELVGIIVDRYQ